MALSNEHVETICKMGQKEQCCRYLTCGVDGFECEKNGPFKKTIDSRAPYMTAKGDNCKGMKYHDDKNH
jgi:hypothetical protein